MAHSNFYTQKKCKGYNIIKFNPISFDDFEKTQGKIYPLAKKREHRAFEFYWPDALKNNEESF